MLQKYNFTLFGITGSFIFRLIKEKSELHYGVGSRCIGGQYVLFLDYDNTPLDWIQEEIAFLQKNNKGSLSDAFVFQTKRGYHVIFLEKHTIGEICELLNYTTCDRDYKTVPLFSARKLWVLRQSKKKDENLRYLKSYPCDSSPFRKRSLAHALYLQNIMGVPRKDLGLEKKNAFDKEEELYVGYYHIQPKNN